MHADDFGTGLPQLLVATITGRRFRAGHPSRVPLSASEGQHSGLLSDSVVMTDSLAAIADSAITRVIASLPMNAVDTALAHALGLTVAVTTPGPSRERLS